MRFVIETEPGKLEFNYMWVPTWIGMSKPIKQEIEDAIGEKFVGRTIETEEQKEAVFDEMDEAIIELLQSKFPAVNFTEYLRALKHVEQQEG